MSADGVEHVQSGVMLAKDQKFYADLSGTSTIQQRVRVHPTLTAVAVDRSTGAFETMRTLAAPAARGWEYLTGDLVDWAGELAEIPELLRRRSRRPRCRPGAMT